jgi:hypothetical protein
LQVANTVEAANTGSGHLVATTDAGRPREMVALRIAALVIALVASS